MRALGSIIVAVELAIYVLATATDVGFMGQAAEPKTAQAAALPSKS